MNNFAVTTQPPTLPAGILGGHFLKFRRQPTEFLTAAARLGDVSRFRLGNQPMFFVNHPDLIRDVLVTNAAKFHKGRALQRMKRVLGQGLLTSEGEFHLRQRRLAQPTFHRQRIAGYAASMVEYGERVSGEWRDGETYDISEEMMRLTLYIVAKTLFGANVENEADEIGDAMTTLIGAFNYLLLPFSELLEKLPLPIAKRFNKAKETIDRVIYKIISERRQTGEDRGDLLSMLLLAQDEDDGGRMTDEQVRDECLTLFLAGHETTANALTWTWYLLSQNPEVEQRFYEEINRVLPGKLLPTFEDYANLNYVEAVLAESMRLYPPAWAIGRLAIENHKLNNFPVEKGALVLLSPYAMQRDGRFWNDPETFHPERWANISVKEASQKFVYFPFGGGVRRCIGEQFAWTEGVLLLATIARKWRLRLLPEQKIALNPLVTLRPKYGMKMTAFQR
ncbi:MAG: cytochrome P450 [Acidobacteriota bacterium]|nr:cytochrome P450 [Acidobacteriota bacterium]